MNHKTVSGHKRNVYAAIIGLVLVVNILLNAASIFISYPTEAHRATARQLDVISVNMLGGDDIGKIMDSESYKKAAESHEANYSNAANAYTLIVSWIAGIALIGAVYRYVRTRRLSKKVVRDTVLLVSIGQFLPLLFTHIGMALYLGTQLPGLGTILFMAFIGIVIAPLVVLLFARIFDWYYNRKHSFVID